MPPCNGAVALPTRQLDVFALRSAQAAEQVPDDLNRIRLDGGPSRVTWRDENGPVLFNGHRRDELTTTDERSYVLLGEATVTPGDGLSTVMDPNLPPWIGEEIRGFAPRVGHYYRDRLGAPGYPDLPLSLRLQLSEERRAARPDQATADRREGLAPRGIEGVVLERRPHHAQARAGAVALLLFAQAADLAGGVHLEPVMAQADEQLPLIVQADLVLHIQATAVHVCMVVAGHRQHHFRLWVVPAGFRVQADIGTKPHTMTVTVGGSVVYDGEVQKILDEAAYATTGGVGE